MSRKFFKFSLLFSFASLMGLFGLGFVTNVPTKPTESDVAVFRSILRLDNLQLERTFIEEINLIREPLKNSHDYRT